MLNLTQYQMKNIKLKKLFTLIEKKKTKKELRLTQAKKTFSQDILALLKYKKKKIENLTRQQEANSSAEKIQKIKNTILTKQLRKKNPIFFFRKKKKLSIRNYQYQKTKIKNNIKDILITTFIKNEKKKIKKISKKLLIERLKKHNYNKNKASLAHLFESFYQNNNLQQQVYESNNLFAFNFSMVEFMRLNFHTGKDKRINNNKQGLYLIRKQNKYAFMNITFAYGNFKRGTHCFKTAIIDNSRILMVAWSKNFKHFVPRMFYYHYFYRGPWFPGFLGNFRHMHKKGNFHLKEAFSPVISRVALTNVTSLILASLGIRSFPNIICIIDTNNLNLSSLLEAMLLHMLSFTILSSSIFLDTRYPDFGFLSNTKNVELGTFFIYFFSTIIVQAAYTKKMILI